MVITVSVMFKGFGELVDKAPPGTGYGVFITGILFVVLISPFSLPGIVVRIIRKLRREIIEQCQLWDEDHL
jgi:hypothetical protein